MAKDCLYCGLQYTDTTNFCPDCGRQTERGFRIRSFQELEFELLLKEMKGKDDVKQKLVLAVTRIRVEGNPGRETSIEGGERFRNARVLY